MSLKKVMVFFVLLVIFALNAAVMYGNDSPWRVSINNGTIKNVVALSDGGVIGVGESSSTTIPGVPNNGGTDIYIVKLDKTGAVVTEKLLGTAHDDIRTGFERTHDGGYLIAIKSNTDLVLYKCDADLNIVSEKIHNNFNRYPLLSKGHGTDFFVSSGRTIYIIDQLGDIKNSYTMDREYKVQTASDGGYILYSSGNDFMGTKDIIKKLSPSFVTEWTESYSHPADDSGMMYITELNGYVYYMVYIIEIASPHYHYTTLSRVNPDGSAGPTIKIAGPIYGGINENLRKTSDGRLIVTYNHLSSEYINAPYISYIKALDENLATIASTEVLNQKYTNSDGISGQGYFTTNGSEIIRFRKAFGDLSGYTNLALHKPVKASSMYSTQYGPTNVNDGDYNTVWGSSTKAGHHWVYFDLGIKETINGISIDWYKNYYATIYDVAISDDAVNWTFIHEELDGKGGKENIYLNPVVSARYVGFLLKLRRDVAYGISEIGVYQE